MPSAKVVQRTCKSFNKNGLFILVVEEVKVEGFSPSFISTAGFFKDVNEGSFNPVVFSAVRSSFGNSVTGNDGFFGSSLEREGVLVGLPNGVG